MEPTLVRLSLKSPPLLDSLRRLAEQESEAGKQLRFVMRLVELMSVDKKTLLEQLSQAATAIDGSRLIPSRTLLRDEDIRRAVCEMFVRTALASELTNPDVPFPFWDLLRFSNDAHVVSMAGAYLDKFIHPARTYLENTSLFQKLLSKARHRKAYLPHVLAALRRCIGERSEGSVFSALSFVSGKDGDCAEIALERLRFAVKNGFVCEHSSEFLSRVTT